MSVNTLDAMMSPVSECLDGASLRALVALRASPEAAERLEWLAMGANEGTLSDEEKKEYEGCVMFGNFLGILQSKARQRLATL
jgi:hypothetical protein